MQRVIYLRRATVRRDQQALQQQLERMFQHQWSQPTMVAVVTRARDTWRPPADIYETETAIVVTVELPGMRDAHIELTLDEDSLHIRGVRPEQRTSTPQYYHQMGVNYGPFELDLFIGPVFDPETVSAQYDDGFLVVQMRKHGARG